MDGPDTFALAQRMAQRLCAKAVERLEVPEGRWQANVLLMNCVGQVIQRVRSHGRWVFLDFSHGVTWACELAGAAAWVVDDADNAEARKRPAVLIRIHLREGRTAALLGRPTFVVLPTERVGQHKKISGLGPDPLVSAGFGDVFGHRLRRAAQRTLAWALGRQEIVAGVSNAVKCEALFALRLAPGTRVGSMLASQIDSAADAVARLSRAAADAALHGDTPAYHVFGRAGEACDVCRGMIQVDHSGGDRRQTWYCPVCQTGGGGTLFAGSRRWG